jgi:hypothetical protein
MALTIAGILAGLGSAGAAVYGASQASNGGGSPLAGKTVGLPYMTGGQTYLSRLFALNAATPTPSFTDYVKSGGTAVFPMQGAGQFTPQEAQRLGFVNTANQPTSWFDPTKQNRLTEQQVLDVGARQRVGRAGGKRSGPSSPDEQLSAATEKVMRGERLLREGQIGPKRGAKVTRKLTKNRQEIERLRAQLFGAPNTPGPWERSTLSDLAIPGNEFYQPPRTGPAQEDMMKFYLSAGIAGKRK